MAFINKMSEQTKAGFTLIQLCIVVIVIGILMSALMPLYLLHKKQDTLKQQDSTISTIRTALSDFIIDDPADPNDSADVRYPCPAPLDAAPGSPTYGLEQCITGAIGTCSNGVCIRAGTGGNPVLIGAVPTKTLAIGGEYMLDAYGNRLTYAVSKALTVPLAMKTMTVPGAVKIVDESGAVTTAAAQFALVSHGADGVGSYTNVGVKNGAGCSSAGSAGETENCNDDAVFRYASAQNGTNTANYNDDKVAFTLSDDKDDKWWRQTDASGLSIVNRNPQMVGIGITSGDPTQKLDINGSARARENVTNDWSMTAGQNLVAGLSIIAAQNVTAQAGNVTAGQSVSAVGSVTAQGEVRAQHTLGGYDVEARRDAKATNTVSAGNEVSSATNLRAGASIYAKNMFYKTAPGSSAAGDGSSTATPSGNLSLQCPDGQALRGIDHGVAVCVPSNSFSNFTCDPSAYVTGFDLTGKPTCVPLAQSGAIKTFACYDPPILLPDGRSSYENCAVNIDAVAAACIENYPGSPFYDLAHARPQPYGNRPFDDFLNTCGARFCVSQGYEDGHVTEYAPVYWRDGVPIPTPDNDPDLAGKGPVEVKCTRL